MKTKKLTTKWTWAVYCGIISFVATIAFTLLINSNLSKIPQPQSDLSEAFKENYMGAFSTYYRYPLNPDEPAFSLSFDRMQTASGKIGLFSSGLKRRLEIENLKIKLFQDTPAVALVDGKTSKTKLRKNINNKTDVKRLALHLIRNVSGQHQQLSYDGLTFDLNVDLTNLFELKVDGFDFEQLVDDKSAYSICCVKAESDAEDNRITLRGKVVINTIDGLEIKTNNALWDYSNEIIHIKGRYFAKRGDAFDTGENLTLNLKLTELAANNNPIRRVACLTESQHLQ